MAVILMEYKVYCDYNRCVKRATVELINQDDLTSKVYCRDHGKKMLAAAEGKAG